MNHGQNLIAMNDLLSHQVARGSQMTIFYNGQVMVLDDIPAEKAKEIMSFTSKGTSQTQHSHGYTFSKTHPSFLATNTIRTSASSSGPVFMIPSSTVNNSVQDHPQVPSTPAVYDLPMTRKASLNRFLEKRKDRIAARAPYQTSNIPMATLSKRIEESMSWLALAPQSPQHKSESSSSSVLF